MSEFLKKVALNNIHESLGAKMVPFAGFLMPLKYSSETEEHKAVRESVGVFDVSHMGEFFVEGPEALELLQWVTSNDASRLEDGQAQYSCLPNDQGGIVDDLLIYRFNAQKYLLVVNASNIDKDFNWIEKQNHFDAQLSNHSEDFSLFAVQGPNARQALQSLTSIDLAELEYYTFTTGDLAGAQDVIISATGYTGAGGFELYVKNSDAEKVWEAIFKSGQSLNIKPIGLGARDTLRMEMGYCLYGNDINDTTSPLEAGLGWITKLNKEFVGSKLLSKQKEEGVTKRLVGLLLKERGIPRAGYTIHNEQDEKIGQITSGTQSPSLGQGIGIGYLKKEYSKKGTEVFVGIRNKKIAAEVVKFPFYTKA